jgi:hypothetical protein
VDARGREGKKEVPAGNQPAALEHRTDDLVGGARIRGGLEHDQLARVKVFAHLLDCRNDVGKVGVFRLAQRRRDADADGIGLGEDREVFRGRQPARVDQLAHAFARHIRDVGHAPSNTLYPALIQIHRRHGEAGVSKLDGKRQADVAETNDAHSRLARTKALDQTFGRPAIRQ